MSTFPADQLALCSDHHQWVFQPMINTISICIQLADGAEDAQEAQDTLEELAQYMAGRR